MAARFCICWDFHCCDIDVNFLFYFIAFEKARGHKIERPPYIQRILSGRSLEDKKSMQHGHTKSGHDRPGSGLIDTNTHLNPGREYYREHYPSHSQPPALLHSHPDSLVTESPLTNLCNGYISSSSSIHRGPSNNSGTGNRNSGPQGHSPHPSNSRSKKHRKNKKYGNLFKQSPVKHPDHNKRQSGISRDVGLHGSNSANYTVSEFSEPAGTFFPNPLLNPRNERFREHRTASSQPPPFVQKHPDSIRLYSPLTSLYNDHISSSTSLRRVPPKNGGTSNQGHSPDHRYSSYDGHHRKKHHTLGQEPPIRHPDGSKSLSRTSGDVSLFGSNSPNSSISEFSVPTGTFIPNAFLNPSSKHSREHHFASSQSPPLLQKHPEGIRLDSPLTNLYNEFVSSSNSVHCGPPKNDGTNNRNAGYQGHGPDRRYSTYHATDTVKERTRNRRQTAPSQAP